MGQNWTDELLSDTGMEKYAAYAAGEIRAPLDITNVKKRLDSLTENMRKKREQVYQFVLGQRLNRRQANRVHTLQYQPGEYVLVSKANTKKEREKTKPMWTGPYIVKEIISNNVYRVE